MEPGHPQQTIRAKCFHPSRAFVHFKKAEVEQSIPRRLEQIVAKYPERTAVKSGRSTLSYDVLNRVANRLARAILALHGESNEPVVLLFDHDAPMISAILAVLKAGKICVPLDPSYPEKRAAHIIEETESRVIVTNNKNLPLATRLSRNALRLINLDEVDSHLSSDNIGLVISPDTLAYITYTSGSTGQPKGVVQNHRGLLHKAMLYTNMFHICEHDRLTLLHPCSFAGCFYSILSSLLNGASLFPFDPRLGKGLQLARWLIEEQVTIYHSVPMVLRQMLDAFGGEGEFPHLRVINLSGVPMTGEDVELYKKHFSTECILINSLGTTEAGYIRHYFIDKATRMTNGRIPVGCAIEDKEVTLLDDSGGKVGFGQTGEIAVTSRYLSPGYWRKPELTRAKFLPALQGEDRWMNLTGDLGRMEPDGSLVYIGRKDFQVKVRGYRVDLGEIEIALLEHPAIRQVAVVGQEVRSGDTRVVAYFVPAREPASAASELRHFLQERLPDYMIPSAFMMLRALPLTPNGKVDREALPVPGMAKRDLQGAFVAPRNRIEQTLARIWEETLHLDQVGMNDNFFDLGGDSLLATQAISRARDTFHADVPMRALFENPTVSGLAVQIAEALTKATVFPDEMADMLADLESLSDEEAERMLAQENPERSEIAFPSLDKLTKCLCGHQLK